MAVGGSIKSIISIVHYSTFRRWVNDLGSGDLQTKPLGRPRTTTQEIVAIIIRIAKENLDWGYGRILGELKKIGINRGRTTIKNVMVENGIDPAPKRYEDSLDAYLKRTFETLYACDFFSKTIWTPLGIETVFVLFFINIRTRKVHIAGISYKPTPEWVKKHARKLEEFFAEDDSRKLLIRDGDGKYLFLSNYTLYGDISNRVMETLRQFVSDVEIYSIDEAFLSLNGYESQDLSEYMRTVRDTVSRWTDIPVSIGSTNTLPDKSKQPLATLYNTVERYSGGNMKKPQFLM